MDDAIPLPRIVEAVSQARIKRYSYAGWVGSAIKPPLRAASSLVPLSPEVASALDGGVAESNGFSGIYKAASCLLLGQRAMAHRKVDAEAEHNALSIRPRSQVTASWLGAEVDANALSNK